MCSLRKPQTSSIRSQFYIAQPPVVDLHEYVRHFFESMGVAVVTAVKEAEEQLGKPKILNASVEQREVRVGAAVKT